MRKRFIAIFLCCILLFGLAACKPGDGADETEPSDLSGGEMTEQVLRLPYSKADSLNPFESKGLINRQLALLLYDGLFRLDKTYKPAPLLASGYTMEGRELTVTLADAVFSDGSRVRAEDVVASFQLAKKSEVYGQRLLNISSVVASGNRVTFKLLSPDPHAAACLDFAVVRTQGNNLPMGSGRYVYLEGREGVTLERNTRRQDFNPAIPSIALTDVTDSASLLSAIAIGNISFAYNELSSGQYQRINASTVETSLNNLVYLAFNSGRSAVARPAFRRAVALLLGRDELVLTAFQGHARAAATPFNPDWYALAGLDEAVIPSTSATTDKSAVAELLAEAGYSQYKLQNTSFSLLANADNPFKRQAADQLAVQLAKGGMNVKVRALAFKEYEAAVRAGSYDFYLGEVKLSGNMSLTPLLGPGGAVGFGIDPECDAAYAYGLFLKGDLDLQGFLDAFTEDPPLLPLCYRNAVAGYARSLQTPRVGCDGDIFCDIDRWMFAGQSPAE